MRHREFAVLLVVLILAVAGVAQEKKQALPLEVTPGKHPEMQALAPLIGAWDVTMQVAQPDGAWQEQKTTSKFISILGGAALEQQIRIDYFGPVNLVGAWSFDRFQKVYRMAWLDDQAGLLDVYEGKLEDGRLSVSNVGPNTFFTARGKPTHGRQILYDITPDSFRVDIESSPDGGKTWHLTNKARFTRRATGD